MSGQNILDEAVKYMQFDNVPSTMKELNSRYRKLALIMHPDKHGNSSAAKKDFQELLNHYKVLGDYIINNDNNDSADEEEKDNMDIFKQFNFDQKNIFSPTINIENNLANAWKVVLTQKFGDRVEKKDTNGLLFQHSNFVYNSESVTITVTLWIMPKTDNQSKLLIQSKKQVANDVFTLKNLPDLYSDVRNTVLVKFFNSKTHKIAKSYGADGYDVFLPEAVHHGFVH